MGLEVACRSYLAFRFWASELPVCREFYPLSPLPSLHAQKLYTLVLLQWVTAESHLTGGGQVDNLVCFCSILFSVGSKDHLPLSHKPWGLRGAKGGQFTILQSPASELRAVYSSHKSNTEGSPLPRFQLTEEQGGYNLPHHLSTRHTYLSINTDGT